MMIDSIIKTLLKKYDLFYPIFCSVIVIRQDKIEDLKKEVSNLTGNKISTKEELEGYLNISIVIKDIKEEFEII